MIVIEWEIGDHSLPVATAESICCSFYSLKKADIRNDKNKEYDVKRNRPMLIADM